MLNNIYLGLKDFTNSFVENITYIIFLSGIILALNLSISSIVFELNYSSFYNLTTEPGKTNIDSFIISYDVGYDDNINEELIDSLSKFYKKGSYTYITDLIEQNNENYLVYFILGDPPGFPRVEGNSVKVYSRNYDKDVDTFKLSLNQDNIKINQVLESDFTSVFNSPYDTISGGEDYIIYVVVNDFSLKDWISPNVPEDIYEVVNNSYIDIEDFEEFSSSFDGTFLKVYQREGFKELEETKYILYFLFPLIFLLILAFSISIYNIIKGMIHKKSEEFTVHLLCGATFTLITIRILTTFLANLLIVVIVHKLFFFFNPYFIYMTIIQCLLLLIIILFIIMNKLKNSNLLSNLRGE